MAHGVQSVLKRTTTASSKAGDNNNNNNNKGSGKTGIGSRRIFPPHFKLQVLDSYRNDSDCKGNQRATARKYGIHRRQIQKWLQAEVNLRNSVNNNNNNNNNNVNNNNNNNSKGGIAISSTTAAAVNGTTHVGGCDLSLSGCCRLRDDSAPDAYYHSASEQPRVPCIGAEAYEPCCGSPQANVHAAAALDYSSSSSNSSLCDMLSNSATVLLLSPSSPTTSLAYARSPSLSPSQYNKSPSPVISDHPYLHHPIPMTQDQPIDLSVKHRRAISPYVAAVPLAPLYASCSFSEDTRMQDPEVWDLSVRKRPFKQEPQQVEVDQPPSKRPVKLFKPYLDDNQDSDETEQEEQMKPQLISPVNNNYSPPISISTLDYNSPCCPSSSTATAGYYHHAHYSIPYTGYCPQPYDIIGCQPPMVLPLKQRHSYSVDFKLRAIETYYYGDECCRGNQRAVAHKYNVHRRQVQKWLRQEDELRTRTMHGDPAQMTNSTLPLVR